MAAVFGPLLPPLIDVSDTGEVDMEDAAEGTGETEVGLLPESGFSGATFPLSELDGENGGDGLLFGGELSAASDLLSLPIGNAPAAMDSIGLPGPIIDGCMLIGGVSGPACGNLNPG